MKRLFNYVLCAFCAAALFSCAKEIEQPKDINEVVPEGSEKLILKAVSQDTRTAMDGSGHTVWAAGDAIKVICSDGSVSDFELVDGEHIPWVGTGEENGPVYDGDDDIFFIATVANDGEEDFFYDPTADECTIYACGHVVYKDETGKVIGGADLFMGGLNAQDPRVEIKAGGEAEVLFEGIHCYWPSESQELYVEAVDYE